MGTGSIGQYSDHGTTGSICLDCAPSHYQGNDIRTSEGGFIPAMNVALEDITKVYAEAEILSSIKLDFTSGSFVVILGPSGGGKSTLLRIIAGLVPQTRGRVRFGNQIVDSIAPAGRNVAMVFQKYALYPLTVEANLRLPLAAQALPRDKIAATIKEV